MNDRIRLAEAMGWRKNVPPEAAGWWTHDATKKHRVGPPDPFTDANDCNALIKHLNGLGFDVEIRHNVNDRAWVTIDQLDKPRTHWKGDNWMHGVCELALKVIDPK